VDESMSLAGKEFESGPFTFEFKDEGNVDISAEWDEDEVEEFEGKYNQVGTDVTILIEDERRKAKYDGEDFEIIRRSRSPQYAGFYKEEIKRITMLGDGKELDWKLTGEGLVIDTPQKKPCEHAYVIKIERYHYPKID